MKTLALVLGAFAMSSALVGCSQESTGEDASAVDSELSSSFGANDAIRCSVESSDGAVALIRTKDGKASLLSLTPAGDLFALSRSSGSLTTSGGIKFNGTKTSLTLNSRLTGKWNDGSKTSDVKCEKVSSSEAASWRTANALQDYAGEIDGIAETVVEESPDPAPKAYTIFVVETSRRSSLDLGTKVTNSGGSLSSRTDEDDTMLDENEWSYGAMSAAYSLGGGDDYGEWFQGVSDGVSLIADLSPALGTTATAGYIAHEKVGALSNLVDSQKPSALEITVGAWTFFLPDAFPQ